MKRQREAKLFLVFAAGLMVFAAGGGQAAEEPGAGADYFLSPEFRRPLRSVELQYFRVPAERWELMLTRMAQYQADTISTYVPWGFHEFEEGRFDFSGASGVPERNLRSFLELCARRGFKVILKPGPFIDAETLAGGIPLWLIERYPEAIACSAKAKPLLHGDSGLPRLSYLHPRYLELVGRYYRALAAAVKEYEWPHGPIIALQVDNETPGDGFISAGNYLSWNFKADYNSYYLTVLWPEWLAERYRTVEELNRAWESSYEAFAAVPFPREWTSPASAGEFQLYLDLDRFAEWQYVEGMRRFTALLREAGFQGPAYHNLLCMPWDLAGQLGDAGGMAEAVGGWLGVNVYAEIYRPWTIFVGNLVYKYNWDEYVHLAVWRTRLSRTLSEPRPAFVPEITCSERFYFLAPVAWGADAVNVYVGWQTPKDNPLISPRRSWGMEACVTGEGEVRDCLGNAKAMYLFMEFAGGFQPGGKRPALALGYSHEPEHAWNWEFRFNLNRPHKKPKLKKLQEAVAGTNTNERGQLLAREFVKRDLEFDVLHLDHLRPGQLEQYDTVIIPDAPGVPRLMAEKARVVYLRREENDLEFVARQSWDKFREAWAEAEEVDVIPREDKGEGRTVLAVVNRSGREFTEPVYFQRGEEWLSLRLGPKAVGFVSIDETGLRGAVLDHRRGRGEAVFAGERLAFSGTFGAIVLSPQFALVTAVDEGEVVIQSRCAPRPAKLWRLLLDGRREEADFSFDEAAGRLTFHYHAGQKADRTDLYVLLAPGVRLEEVLGEYFRRLGRGDWVSEG